MLMPDIHPTVWSVSKLIGATWQPWLSRQIGIFREKLDICAVAWEDHRGSDHALSDCRSLIVPTAKVPHFQRSRWLHRLVRITHQNWFAASMADQLCFKHFAHEHRPEAMLVHQGDLALRMLPVAKRLGVPIIYQTQGVTQLLADRWFEHSMRRLARHFSFIITVGIHEVPIFESFGVHRNRIAVIPPGAPTDVFYPVSVYKKTPASRFVIASRLAPEKGIEISIRAFSAVHQRRPDATLTIFGDGPLRSSLQRMVADFGIADAVDIRGYVQEALLATELRKHDIFLQHSLNGAKGQKEGFGASVTEAMASGLPPIVTASGGLLDQVEHEQNGLIVPQGDVDAMASAMFRLMANDDLREQLGIAARKKAMDAFDANSLAIQVRDILIRTCQKEL